MNVDLDRVLAHMQRRVELAEELAEAAQSRADTLGDEIARAEARLHRHYAERLRGLVADLPFYASMGSLS